jgi:hypothetical protein
MAIMTRSELAERFNDIVAADSVADRIRLAQALRVDVTAMLDGHLPRTRPWIGCDLDGTLAMYDGRNADAAESMQPVPEMVRKIRAHLDDGDEVVIVTARFHLGDAEVKRIQDWTEKHVGQRLPVTASKDFAMLRLYDDRVIQIVPNSGLSLWEHMTRQPVEESSIVFDDTDAALCHLLADVIPTRTTIHQGHIDRLRSLGDRIRIRFRTRGDIDPDELRAVGKRFQNAIKNPGSGTE